VEAEAFKVVTRALEQFGVRPYGDNHWRVSCKRCGVDRVVPIEHVGRLRVMQAMFCQACLYQLGLGVKPGLANGGAAPSGIITP